MRRELPTEYQRKHWADKRSGPLTSDVGDRSQERNGTCEENYRLVMDEATGRGHVGGRGRVWTENAWFKEPPNAYV